MSEARGDGPSARKGETLTRNANKDLVGALSPSGETGAKVSFAVSLETLLKLGDPRYAI